MATGFSRTLEAGHEEAFDFSCARCDMSGKSVEALHFCTDCSELYCKMCLEFHASFPGLKDHKVIGRDKKKSTSVPTEPCSQHDGEILQIFCGNQKLCCLCCHVCVCLQHSKQITDKKMSQTSVLPAGGTLPGVHLDTCGEDELKRSSKVAGAKLQDGNPDITDLSDPHRAMKLQERYSDLYDVEWTDAFEAQTDVLKRSTKEAIKSLLNILTVCYEFCKDVADQQMDSLRMVFLHPCQDLCQTSMANKERPRIASKEDKILKDLRKQIGTQSTHEVKQQFLAKMAKSYNKSEDSKKVMGASKAYFQKCAEVCWMLVLLDPPLYMDTSIQIGDKINLNFYGVYTRHGENADFLVWPPLHITGGGLFAKGVVQPISKKKK